MSTHRTPAWERALVTGASAGIGEAFARRLAAQGTARVLVARDTQRLQTLAEQLASAHGIDSEVLAADLADPDGAARVAERIGTEPKIDLLVNNAGLGTRGSFAELGLDGELRQIDVNVSALVHLTHAAISQMTRSGAGTVINVSSMSGLQPVPLMATYGATKAFVNSLTDALHEATRGSGVSVMSVMPGFVRTEFMERTGNADQFPQPPQFAVLTPDQVARHALAAARHGAPSPCPVAATQSQPH
jgi:short-subunit dehydrogenase